MVSWACSINRFLNTIVPFSLLQLPYAVVFLYLSVIDLKITPDLTYTVQEEYDYVIVGSGAAGSTLAARLSEVENATVLLLEAGTTPIRYDQVPIIARFLWGSYLDWDYRTEPQNHTGNDLKDRKVVWPSGKGIGGSTLLNAMFFIRGSKGNFDEWAEMGNTDWSYEKVLPYFKKMEDNKEADYLDNGYHSTGGPMTIERPRYHTPMKDCLTEAATAKGYSIGDPNGPRMTGFADFEATMRGGERCSAALGYLVPVDDRDNLDIVAGAHVTKVLIEDGVAQGVEYDVNTITSYFWGHRRTVKAKREVILSAGTTNTAQLLMLSGIGPKEELDKFQIPVVSDLPVGKGMQDHLSVPLFYELQDYYPGSYSSFMEEYVCNKSGFLASAEAVDYTAFFNTKDNSTAVDKPNLQLYFAQHDYWNIKQTMGYTREAFDQVIYPYKYSSLYFCFCSLVQPRSKGWVRLKSADPYDPPLIDPNYLEDPEDMKDVLAGMRVCDDMILSDAMVRGVGSRPFQTRYPSCEHVTDDVTSDAYHECVARAVIVTMSHQVGTARMGPVGHKDTVVDQQLRVQGVSRLRVVDASVMPVVTSGNTMTPSIMIAEKAADLIKEDMLKGN